MDLSASLLRIRQIPGSGDRLQWAPPLRRSIPPTPEVAQTDGRKICAVRFRPACRRHDLHSAGAVPVWRSAAGRQWQWSPLTAWDKDGTWCGNWCLAPTLPHVTHSPGECQWCSSVSIIAVRWTGTSAQLWMRGYFRSPRQPYLLWNFMYLQAKIPNPNRYHYRTLPENKNKTRNQHCIQMVG